MQNAWQILGNPEISNLKYMKHDSKIRKKQTVVIDMAESIQKNEDPNKIHRPSSVMAMPWSMKNNELESSRNEMIHGANDNDDAQSIAQSPSSNVDFFGGRVSNMVKYKMEGAPEIEEKITDGGDYIIKYDDDVEVIGDDQNTIDIKYDGDMEVIGDDVTNDVIENDDAASVVHQ